MTKSVTPRGNSWEAQVRHSSLPNGRLRKSFKTEHDAEAWAAKTEADVMNGKTVDMRVYKARSQGKTLQDCIDDVITHRWSGQRGERTAVLNTHALVDYFGPLKKMDEIDEVSIDNFVLHLREKGKADGTINRKLSCLSVLFRHAYKRGWVRRRPAIERRPERLTRISYYSMPEQEKIITAFNTLGDGDYARLFQFMCDTGLRLMEALTIEFKDIRPWGDDHAVFIHGGKHTSSPDRTIPLTRRAFNAVYPRGVDVQYQQDGPFTRLSKSTCRSAWERLRKILGKHEDKDFIWHTCRHTFCSLLVQHGESLPVVANLAGHVDIKTTLRYSHLSPLNSVMAIQKLDALSSWTK